MRSDANSPATEFSGREFTTGQSPVNSPTLQLFHAALSCRSLTKILKGGINLYRNHFKRIIDLFLSISGLVVLSPIFIVLMVLIKLDSPGPVLFMQKRVGMNKRHFNIYKFRTMRTDTPRDTPTHMLEDPDRYITKMGKFLRKTSLDELPQIINILFGQMAIIGPRPALWNQYDLIEERDKYGANDIRPGLTGWAQINGRDELPIEVKAKYDGEYVRRMSFFFDLKCFFGTIGYVLKKEGFKEGPNHNS